MNTEIEKIPLEDWIEGGAGIKFLRVEMPENYLGFFAIVRYSLNGREQLDGLRLDMGKQVFLDHFDEQEKEEILKNAAPKIVAYLRNALYYNQPKFERKYLVISSK